MNTTVDFDGLTGESIVRDSTPEEIASCAEAFAEAQARQADEDAKATARESALAKLAALGLTADEVAAL
jgi:DNA-binding NarL/FixJ family response regulator